MKKISRFEFAIMQVADPKESENYHPYTEDEEISMRENNILDTAKKIKKSAHQIWRESKEQNLSKEEFKQKLVDEKVIVRKCIYCQQPTSGINISYCDNCLMKDDYSN